MSEQPRAPSGTFAPKPRPAEPEPAGIPTPVHDLLAAMKAKRLASPDGFLIEPPVPIEKLNKIGQIRHGVAIVHNDKELKSVDLIRILYDWLRRVAAEGIVHDIELAWAAFKPSTLGVKLQHRSIYDELRLQCLHREGQLYAQREKERTALYVVEAKRQAIEAARADVAATELQLEVEVPAELVRRRAYLAELEARA